MSNATPVHPRVLVCDLDETLVCTSVDPAHFDYRQRAMKRATHPLHPRLRWIVPASSSGHSLTHSSIHPFHLLTSRSAMSSPPPSYSPSAPASASASASASVPAQTTVAPSLFAIRVAYRGCAPKNAMVSLDDNGTCLEAHVDEDDDEVVLIVSAQDRNIARCCTQIAEVLHGSIIRCERITTDKQHRAALRPRADSDSDSDSDSDTHSDSEMDRLTRTTTNHRTPTEWAIISLIFLVPALLAYFMGTPGVSIHVMHPSL